MVPFPIAEVELRNIPDETGLTAPEKIALKHAWKLIAPDIGSHAIGQFIEFFIENEDLLDFFRDEGDNIKMKELHMHKHKMFEFLEFLIMDAIESPSKMHSCINPVSDKHMKCNVTMEAYTAIQSFARLPEEDVEPVSVTMFREWTRKDFCNYAYNSRK